MEQHCSGKEKSLPTRDIMHGAPSWGPEIILASDIVHISISLLMNLVESQFDLFIKNNSVLSQLQSSWGSLQIRLKIIN